jgi:hypothetical protein
LFQRSLSEAELTSLLERLKQQGVISVSGTKVSYVLPD